ncbi:Lysine methyltransferase [Aureococcus anophagefferens]|uniref:Lysine methyltransferase n=1 Tax=Aureococcus anophagefferens TaxID=44056 RepID=A0ABR1FLB2_AURAN
MSSYDEVMAESRRLAQRQIQQRNEANAAAWARAHPNTPPPRPKTRFLFFEWDAFDLFCCAPQACALHLEDPLEAAEYDDYDDYDDARAGGVLLDVEIDKRRGLGGSVHTIQLEARLEEDVPAMSPATSDLGRPRDNAKRLSGTWDDDLYDRAGGLERNLEVFVEDLDEGTRASTVALTRDAPRTPEPRHAAVDVGTPVTASRRASSTKRATKTGHEVMVLVRDPVASAGPPPVDDDAPPPPPPRLPAPGREPASREREPDAPATPAREPAPDDVHDAAGLVEELERVDGDFKRFRRLSRAYNKIKAVCKLHAKLDDKEDAFDETLEALFDGASKQERDRVRGELGLPKKGRGGAACLTASSVVGDARA